MIIPNEWVTLIELIADTIAFFGFILTVSLTGIEVSIIRTFSPVSNVVRPIYGKGDMMPYQ